jgi:Mrp family chromosome partitioning ATPase
VIRWIGRNWIVLLTVTAAGTALSVAMMQQMTPLYRAEAVLTRDSGAPTGTNVSPAVRVVNPQALRSRALVGEVVDILREELQHDPLQHWPRRSARDAFVSLIGLGRWPPVVPEPWRGARGASADPTAYRERAITALLDRLEVASGPPLRVRYAAEQPAVAAAVVNALADRFILNDLEVGADVRERAAAWLEDRTKAATNRAASGDGEPALAERIQRAFERSDLTRVTDPVGWDIIYAPEPTDQMEPQDTVVAAAGAVASLLLALVLAFINDAFRSGFVSTEQVRARTGLTTIMPLPATRPARELSPERHLDLVRSAASSYLPGLRDLLGVLQPPDPEPRGRVVAVTSPGAREGKTTLALALARLAGLSGRRVLLIDGAANQASLHSALGMTTRPGLAECLTGRNSLEAVIEIDPPSGSHILLAGEERPRKLFRRPATADFLRALAGIYDLVIVDTEPVLSSTRGAALAGFADDIVLVVRYRETRRSKVRVALRKLRRAGAARICAALIGADNSPRADLARGRRPAEAT